MPVQIAIRTPNHLGDFIMSLPMVQETHEAYPGAEVTALVPEHLVPLLSGNVAVARVIPIAPAHQHGLAGMLRIKALLSDRTYDIGYVLPPSFGSAASFQLAGVRERIGYISDGRRLLLSKPLPLPEPVNSVHRSELYFNLLRRGSGSTLEYSRPKLFLSDTDVEAGRAILGDFGLRPEQPYVVIGFRSKVESRRWGDDNFTRLASLLANSMGLQVVLVGSREDQSAGDQIVSGADAPDLIVNLAGKNDLREVASLMGGAACFVGDDSGPAHLAAATGIPVVVLFGAGDPNETSPLAWKMQLLYRSELPCISCIKNKCPLTGAQRMACMTGISVESVLDAVHALIQ